MNFNVPWILNNIKREKVLNIRDALFVCVCVLLNMILLNEKNYKLFGGVITRIELPAR